MPEKEFCKSVRRRGSLAPNPKTTHYGLTSFSYPALVLTILALVAMAPTLNAQSPPTFSKTFNPDTMGPGSVSTLLFTITNPGSLPVQNLTFTDTLPTGVAIATPANATSDCGGELDAPAGGGAITLSDGAVEGLGSCSIAVDVTSSTVAVHTNVSGDLTSDAGNSGSASADLTVASDRPGFSKSFAPSSVTFGNRATLTFTIDNGANSQAAANLTFSDNLPDGMVVASPANTATDCNGGNLTATPGGDVISYAFAFFGDASVAAGSSCTVSVDVLGNAVGTLNNTTSELTSTLTGGFSFRSSGKASASLNVTIDQLSLSKEFTNDPVAPGGTVTLELTVRNLDRRSAAENITFTDDLDATLAGLVASGLPQSNVCGPGSQLSGTSTLSLTGGNLDAEASCTFSVTLQVPAGAPSGAFTNTTSTISADVDGRSVIGTAATDLLFVEATPLLTKSFLDSTTLAPDPVVGAGDSVVLEFTIQNPSPSTTATDIAFEDIFDVVLPTAVSGSIPTSGFCGEGSQATFTPLVNPQGSDAVPARLAISDASLEAGGSCAFQIELNVAQGAATGTYPIPPAPSPPPWAARR